MKLEASNPFSSFPHILIERPDTARHVAEGQRGAERCGLTSAQMRVIVPAHTLLVDSLPELT
jgi:hypothetical protein